MSELLFLTNMDRQGRMLEQTRQELAVDEGSLLPAEVRLISESNQWNREWQTALQQCSLVVVSWMGSSRDTVFLQKVCAFLTERQIPFTMLATDPQLSDALYGITIEERERLRCYLTYSGRENYRQLWRYLNGALLGQNVTWREPATLAWNGIYHPAATEFITERTVYAAQFMKADRPTVAVLFPRDEWIWGDLSYQRLLVEEIERQDMNALVMFSYWARNEELGAPGVDDTLRVFAYDEQGRPAVDVLINAFKFSLTVGKPVQQGFLQDLGVPILQAYTLLQPVTEWQERAEGLTPMEVSCSVSMPEFDGVVHAVPIATKESSADGTFHNEPLPDGVQLVVRKAKKWAALRRKNNADKKIAIIFHNYPATNAAIGSAQGLDSPASVCRLLAALQTAGYQVESVSPDSRSLMDALLQVATNDRRYRSEAELRSAYGRVSDAQYRTWFDAWTDVVQAALIKDWGAAPGEVFHYGQELIIPGMLNGNIFITVQPPRGFEEDPGKIYHSPDATPTHHYLAYYHWLQNIWQADAVIHVGTHGTLEWLPGKGAGLSPACYPALAIGDLPNLYPYLLSIVGEGIQAKRRGAAVLIGHLPAPMGRAGSYEELAELEQLLDEYSHFKVYQPANCEVVAAQILDKVEAAELDGDMGRLANETMDEYVLRLHHYLTDLKNMQIRVGLHILGKAPTGDSLVEYVLALTKLDNVDAPSLPRAIAVGQGYDYDALFAQSGVVIDDQGYTGAQRIEAIYAASREVVEFLANRQFSAAALAELAAWPWVAQLANEGRAALLQCLTYVSQTLAPNLQRTETEITHLLAGLEGGYVLPGPAGAPSSGCVDILPTGRNFYGVDPRTLPTPAAWEIGKTLGEQMIERYIADEGRYPEEIGMVLWSGANMRSHGQCVAEFLYLLGVRPVWQKGSRRVCGIEAIPLSELQRPRLDVTARMSGLFRDTLPQAVRWLDAAVRLVAALEEPDHLNYVRKHAAADAAAWVAEGMEAVAAREQALLRIFGCPPGAYGAGVSHLLEEKNWETVDDLANVYVRWGAHAYGAKQSGRFVPQAFSRRLSQLDVTIKNEDNREVHMLNSDDFNSYHGGMIAAVRSLKGRAPQSYCGDSTDRQRVMLRSLPEEFKRLFRGEVMNPQYIQGMQQHGYKGAADLAGVVAHCYEWDATSAVMENWMYEGLARKYALDQTMQEWMKDVNPWALERLTDKLLEAAQRGLWQAKPETLEALKELCLSIEGDLEERADA